MNDEARENVRVSRHFDAVPERVYGAWLDPDHARKWLFATESGEVVRAEMDPRPGGRFVIVDRRDGDDVEHTGEYLELTPPKRIVFTFQVPKYSDQVSRVLVEIRPDAMGCELTLTNEGIPPEWVSSTEEGWRKILDGLAANL